MSKIVNFEKEEYIDDLIGDLFDYPETPSEKFIRELNLKTEGEKKDNHTKVFAMMRTLRETDESDVVKIYKHYPEFYKYIRQALVYTAFLDICDKVNFDSSLKEETVELYNKFNSSWIKYYTEEEKKY